MTAGQLGLTGGAQPIFFLKTMKNKYTTTIGSPTAQKICSKDDGVSSLFNIVRHNFFFVLVKKKISGFMNF
jgi:hypothetical protein